VLATGAIERPLVFPGNDRPGILLAGAARTYLNRYGVRVGLRAVVVTADDAAYRTALDLHARRRGDRRHRGPARARSGRRAARGGARGRHRVLPAATVLGTVGDLRVEAIDMAQVDEAGVTHFDQRLPCDVVLMSGGYNPSVHLFSQSRGKLAWSESLKAFVPGESAECERSAGRLPRASTVSPRC
jgi:sarcosine oxidase, subunit alpha